MVGELCRFYGWEINTVLSMPATQFFAMLEAKKKLQAVELMHACHVARSADVSDDQFENLMSFYRSLGEEIIKPTPPETPRPGLKGTDATNALMQMFGGDKRLSRARIVVH